MVHYMQAIRADSRGAAGHLVTGRAAVVSQCCDMCLSVCHVGYFGTAYYTSPELIRVASQWTSGHWACFCTYK